MPARKLISTQCFAILAQNTNNSHSQSKYMRQTGVIIVMRALRKCVHTRCVRVCLLCAKALRSCERRIEKKYYDKDNDDDVNNRSAGAHINTASERVRVREGPLEECVLCVWREAFERVSCWSLYFYLRLSSISTFVCVCAMCVNAVRRLSIALRPPAALRHALAHEFVMTKSISHYLL